MLKMRKRYVAVLVIVIVVAIVVVISYMNRLTYTILTDDDFMVKIYRSDNWHISSPEDGLPSIEQLLAIDEKTAVEIADLYFKNCSDRKYKVYYVEESNCYFITVRYMDNFFDRNSESSCYMLISKENGAILNIRYITF